MSRRPAVANCRSLTSIIVSRMLILCSAAGAPVEAGVAVLVVLLLSDVHSVVHRGCCSTALRNDVATVVVIVVVGNTCGW